MEEKEKVLARLEALGIPYELTEHPAVYTIEEMDNLKITEKGDVCKNLFLRDAKGTRHFLVVLDKDKKADLKKIQEQLGSSRLSFASEERLMKHLGLSKGSVTPLGILNDAENTVEVVLDEDLKGRKRLGLHPNTNTATVWLDCEDVLKFIRADGHEITYVTL